MISSFSHDISMSPVSHKFDLDDVQELVLKRSAPPLTHSLSL